MPFKAWDSGQRVLLRSLKAATAGVAQAGCTISSFLNLLQPIPSSHGPQSVDPNPGRILDAIPNSSIASSPVLTKTCGASHLKKSAPFTLCPLPLPLSRLLSHHPVQCALHVGQTDLSKTQAWPCPSLSNDLSRLSMIISGLWLAGSPQPLLPSRRLWF